MQFVRELSDATDEMSNLLDCACSSVRPCYRSQDSLQEPTGMRPSVHVPETSYVLLVVNVKRSLHVWLFSESPKPFMGSLFSRPIVGFDIEEPEITTIDSSVWR